MTNAQRYIEVIEPGLSYAQRRHRARLHEERQSATATTDAVMTISGFIASIAVLVLTIPSIGDLTLTLECLVDVLLSLCLAVLAFVAAAMLCGGILATATDKPHSWRHTPEHYFCPECRFHLPSTVAWICPRCSQINSGDNEHSYLATCKRCEQPVDAILCPRCKRAIRVDSEDPIRSIALVAGRHPSQSSEE